MRQSDRLEQFVHDALAAGRSRAEVESALAAEGWSASEVAGALSAWQPAPGFPPVPRPRPYVSAREAFLYGLMLIALAMVTFHLGALFFALIDLWLPDPNVEPYGIFGSMRWSIATLVVFLPLFVVLNSRAQAIRTADPAQRRSIMRKWFGFLTLFIACVVLLGDAIFVIYALLSGEMTLRFAAKAGIVALIAALVVLYFREELQDSQDA